MGQNSAMGTRYLDWLINIRWANNIFWQVYKWLKLGYWISMPLVKAFDYFGIDLTPLYYPTDWHGVAKVTRWFLSWPLSISLPIIAFILTWIVKAIVQFDSSKE